MESTPSSKGEEVITSPPQAATGPMIVVGGRLVEAITQLTPNDILLGRGAPIANYEGNVRFRRLVSTRKEIYMASGRLQVKQAIANELYQEIVGPTRGGRFLAKFDPTELREVAAAGIPIPTSGQVWYVADEKVAMEKVKQALRDKEQFHEPPTAGNTLLGVGCSIQPTYQPTVLPVAAAAQPKSDESSTPAADASHVLPSQQSAPPSLFVPETRGQQRNNNSIGLIPPTTASLNSSDVMALLVQQDRERSLLNEIRLERWRNLQQQQQQQQQQPMQRPLPQQPDSHHLPLLNTREQQLYSSLGLVSPPSSVSSNSSAVLALLAQQQQDREQASLSQLLRQQQMQQSLLLQQRAMNRQGNSRPSHTGGLLFVPGQGDMTPSWLQQQQSQLQQQLQLQVALLEQESMDRELIAAAIAAASVSPYTADISSRAESTSPLSLLRRQQQHRQQEQQRTVIEQAYLERVLQEDRLQQILINSMSPDTSPPTESLLVRDQSTLPGINGNATTTNGVSTTRSGDNSATATTIALQVGIQSSVSTNALTTDISQEPPQKIEASSTTTSVKDDQSSDTSQVIAATTKTTLERHQQHATSAVVVNREEHDEDTAIDGNQTETSESTGKQQSRSTRDVETNSNAVESSTLTPTEDTTHRSKKPRYSSSSFNP